MGEAYQEPCVAIIGGGLGGIALSLCLSRRGVRHKIYEAAKSFGEIGKGISMVPSTTTALLLIDPRLREVFNLTVTYNETPDRRDTWMVFRYAMKDPHPAGYKSVLSMAFDQDYTNAPADPVMKSPKSKHTANPTQVEAPSTEPASSKRRSSSSHQA